MISPSVSTAPAGAVGTASSTEALSKSIEGLSSLAAASPNQNVLPKTANFLSQLEQMMTQVKREAAALEGMKARLKEMDELKHKYSEAKQRLVDKDVETQELRKRMRDMELANGELRQDFQKLNDIYSADRTKLADAQQQLLRGEQEVSGLKLQNDFLSNEAQKIPELKKAIKHLKKEVNQVRAAADEEKAAQTAKAQETDKALKTAERAKTELSHHIWQLTEEINALKQAVESEKDKGRQKLDERDKRQAAVQLQFERRQMLFEDALQQKQRYWKAWTATTAKLDEQRDEAAMLMRRLAAKEHEAEQLQERLAASRSEQDDAVVALQQKVAQSSDALRELQQKNHQLEKELISFRSRCASLTDENESMGLELRRLRQITDGELSERQSRELDLAATVRQVTQERDEVAYQLQALTALHEGFQQQTKLDQKKLWDELKALKDNEAALLEEADKLTQELQEKTVQLHQLEAERMSKETAFRAETDGVSGFLNTLKDELEKRVSELVLVRQERDLLLHSVEEKDRVLDEMHQELARLDQLFKSTMNDERTKFKAELAQKTAKLKQLETEKQELLSETHELMTQATEAQRSVTTMKTQADEARAKAQEALDQVDVMRARYHEAQADVKRLQANEEAWAEKLRRADAKLQEEAQKMELQARELRKNGSQQVLDLSKQLKTAFDDCEELRRQIASMTEQQQRLEQEKERLRGDLHKQNASFQDDRDALHREVQTLKRDLHEQRTKSKQVAEVKTRLEMDLISVRMDVSKYEAELAKASEKLKLQETELLALMEKHRAAVAAQDTLQTTKNALASRVSDLETTLAAKDRTIDALNADLLQLERDGLTEIRRLRLLATSAEQENAELKQLKDAHDRDVADLKQSTLRQQQQTAATVNNLREELRVAEEALSKERRVRGNEIDELRRTLRDCEKERDKFRAELDEAQHRQRADRQERETRVDALQEEIERLRATVRDRELAMEELETQVATQRRRYAELQDRAEKSEQDTVADHAARLDAEVKERKRVEAKHRALQSQYDALEEQLQRVTEQQQAQAQQQALLMSMSNALQPRAVSRGGLFSAMAGTAAPSASAAFAATAAGGDEGSGGSGGAAGGVARIFSSDEAPDDSHDASQLAHGGLASARTFHSQSSSGLLALRGQHLPPMSNAAVPPLSMGGAGGGGGGGGTLQPLSMSALSARLLPKPDSRGGAMTPSRGNPFADAAAFESPRRSNATGGAAASVGGSSVGSSVLNAQLVGSPAVDRVSMALAFKMAQQQRTQQQSGAAPGGISMVQTPVRGLPPMGDADDVDGGGGGSPGRVVRGIHALDFSSVPQSNAPQSHVGSSAHSFGGAGGGAGTSSAAPFGGVDSDAAAAAATGSSEVEETIRRAQEALRRRANGGLHATNAANAAANANAAAGKDTTGKDAAKTPTSGRRLKETLQHAQSMYSGGGGGGVEPLQLDLATPSPRMPAPPVNQPPYAAGGLHRDDDDDADGFFGGDDGEDDYDASDVAAGGGKAAALDLRLNLAASVGDATSGGGGGGVKKKKKKKSVVGGGAAGGKKSAALFDALPKLPK